MTFLQKLCHRAIKNSLFSYTDKFTSKIYKQIENVISFENEK